MYHCGCHGNLVTIAKRYVVDAYRLIELLYQIWTQYDLRQRNYKVKCIRLRLIDSQKRSTWLASAALKLNAILSDLIDDEYL